MNQTKPYDLPDQLVLTQHGREFELVWDAAQAAWIGAGHCVPLSRLMATVVE